MELLDYIRKNYKTPNVAVLKTLGATNELIKYLVNTPNNTNIKVVESLINEGGSEAGNGIKSITISPAITTTPALDSLFPIYWDDLPEGEIEEGVEYRGYETTLHTGYALTNGTQYTISVTPTSDWRATHVETEGDIGETITFTVSVIGGKIVAYASVDDSVPEKVINADIIITE